MLLLGKRHTILIDNKGGRGRLLRRDRRHVPCRSIRWNRPSTTLGDRDKAVVNGQRHKIKVEIFADSKVVEQSFTVPFGQENADPLGAETGGGDHALCRDLRAADRELHAG